MDIILYLVAVALVFGSQLYVQSTFRKYGDIENDAQLSGEQVARRILDANDCQQTSIVMQNSGVLSDFYDPKNNVVSLSPSVFKDATIASIAVAAHECGHAIQYKQGYRFIALRNRILPSAIICGNLSFGVILLGLFLGRSSFGQFVLMLGIAMFAIVALFQLVTLPVEFDASSRALKILSNMGDVSDVDVEGSKKMLTAAAFTYVAALLNTLLQILRFVLISRRRND